MCCLTFEVTGHRRRDASARTVKMYRVPPSGRWWPAVGAPVDRGVRQHCACELAGWTGQTLEIADEVASTCRFAQQGDGAPRLQAAPAELGRRRNAAGGPTNKLKLGARHAAPTFERPEWCHVIRAAISAVNTGTCSGVRTNQLATPHRQSSRGTPRLRHPPRALAWRHAPCRLPPRRLGRARHGC